jgi:hypothetical protein
MDRSLRHRTRRAEEVLSVAKKKREEIHNKFVKDCVSDAWLHATAVAAIVLSGQPKIDEPLIRAWTRALQHYGVQPLAQNDIYLDHKSRLNKQNTAARQLIPEWETQTPRDQKGLPRYLALPRVGCCILPKRTSMLALYDSIFDLPYHG